MIERLKKIWKDPVGSKIIAVIIISIATSIIIYLKSVIQNVNFIESFKSFFGYEFSIWIILLIVFAIVLFVWVFQLIRRTKKTLFSYDDDTLKLDRELFNRIRNELIPQNGSISFLRHNNFAGFSFRLESIDDVYKIEDANRNSDFEFLNPELEKIKEKLIEHIAHFTELIAIQTFPTDNGFQTVPPEWEIEQSDRFFTVVKDIHQTTGNICNKYDELIKKGRRDLKI